MKITVSLKGWEQAKLELDMLEKTHESQVKRIVKHHGSELQRLMKRNAKFRGHTVMRGGKAVFVKPTGETKRSISLELARGGLMAKVGPHTEYSPYLEYGTRFMAAQPFVEKSLNEQGQKFLNDLRKLMK